MRHLPLTIWLLCVALSSANAAEPASAPLSSPRDHAKSILRRPLYQRWRLRQERMTSVRSGRRGLLDDLGPYLEKVTAAWLARIERWFRGRSRGSGPGSGSSGSFDFVALLKMVAWALLVGLVGLAAYALYRNLRGKRIRGHAARVLSREHMREALEMGEALALDSPDWLREADRFAREKNFRAMCRALYLALLSGLHAANRIDFRRNRTNWVYVAHFRGRDDERRVFSGLTSLFDRVWYGLKTEVGVSLDEVKRQVQELLSGGAAP